MPITATVWSAIAASFSAVTAFLMFRVQRTNLRESIRPELVLSGWSRRGHNEAHEIEALGFSTIRNVGRGPALHVYMNALGSDARSRPLYTMSTITCPIIAAGESHDLEESILLYARNIRETGHPVAPVDILIWYHDLHGRRYETRYNLAVSVGDTLMAGVMTLAPGVALYRRHTTRDYLIVPKIKGRMIKIARWRPWRRTKKAHKITQI